MIILKNINGEKTVDTTFRGKRIVMRPKYSTIEIDGKTQSILDGSKEEDRALADFLLQNYKFVLDITDRILQEKGGDLFGKN